MLATFAYAIMRIVPNLQTMYSCLSSMRYNKIWIDTLYRDLNTLAKPPSELDLTLTKGTVVPFNEKIELNGVDFAYQASRDGVLKSVNIVIPKNRTIGLVGQTGCGKTTTVDIIMGLLEPKGGAVTVDGKPILTPESGTDFPHLNAWQRNFGYVPQQIFLADDTVSANIAFGIPEGARAQSVIEQAAKVANIHEFIVNELPQGYDTVVGDRGVRLSGGQRQRIGIARAIYHDPAILVMDEATSSLDSITEDAVMDAINNLSHSKTIIIIAHRISTVRKCDVIYMMDKGRITACGSYDELLATNEEFRAMAKVKAK
jgi:ABC-type multidrug transport system fused ATPase/permease subunit